MDGREGRGLLGGLLDSLDAVARREGTGQSMPDGPPVDLSEYETDPQAFIALAQVAHPLDKKPQIEFDGDLGWPAAPPEDAN